MRTPQRIEVPSRRRRPTGGLKIVGARENNLADIDVEFPLGVFAAVTGVSGAGKSTLVNDLLYPALARKLHASTRRVGRHRGIHGLDQVPGLAARQQYAVVLRASLLQLSRR